MNNKERTTLILGIFLIVLILGLGVYCIETKHTISEIFYRFWLVLFLDIALLIGAYKIK